MSVACVQWFGLVTFFNIYPRLLVKGFNQNFHGIPNFKVNIARNFVTSLNHDDKRIEYKNHLFIHKHIHL